MAELNLGEDQVIQKLKEFEIIKEFSSKNIEALSPFFLKLDLSFLDYLTIRDLHELGSYKDDLSLFAVLMMMFNTLQEGSLCLDINGLTARLQVFVERERAESMFRRFMSNLSENKYKNLIALDSADYKPLVLEEIKGVSLLYFQKLYAHEKSLKERMEVLLETKVSFSLTERQVGDLIEEIFSDHLAIRVSKGGETIEKDKQQVKAIKRSLQNQFSIVSGGPGTGKTSLMVNILRCLVRTGIPVEQIILGAPTGRAAQRMTEAVHNNLATIKEPTPDDKEILKLKGSTLHKILKYRGVKHDFYYGATNPLPASVVVVDEVSMVDIFMMERFLKAVDSNKTRLIFLGDKNQLPSVDAGAVFAEMIPDGKKGKAFEGRLVILEEVYRSGRNLIQLAKEINHGEHPKDNFLTFDAALGLKEDTWSFVQSESVEKWKEHLKLWTEKHYLRSQYEDKKTFKDLILEAVGTDHHKLVNSDAGQSLLRGIFKGIERARILTLLRNSIYGSNVLNNLIARYLRMEFESSSFQKDFFSGAVIMITRNDYSKELFNGDVGVVIQDDLGTYRAFFQRSGSFVSFTMALLPAWEFAFVMTVHKSQGSEFDDVLVVLPDDENHRLLTREIIYTGITRAKKRVILYGKESAFKTALQRKIERLSGIIW